MRRSLRDLQQLDEPEARRAQLVEKTDALANTGNRALA